MSNKLFLNIMCTFVVFASANGVFARTRRCPDNAKTTIYFLPELKDDCPRATTPRQCPAFVRKVRLQGSGVLPNGSIYKYDRSTVDLPPSCNTTLGASGECLIPFVSVAADDSKYRMGDIIPMPNLAGKESLFPMAES